VWNWNGSSETPVKTVSSVTTDGSDEAHYNCDFTENRWDGADSSSTKHDANSWNRSSTVHEVASIGAAGVQDHDTLTADEHSDSSNSTNHESTWHYGDFDDGRFYGGSISDQSAESGYRDSHYVKTDYYTGAEISSFTETKTETQHDQFSSSQSLNDRREKGDILVYFTKVE